MSKYVAAMNARLGPPLLAKRLAATCLSGLLLTLASVGLAACAGTPPVCGIRVSREARRAPQPAPTDFAALLIRGLPAAQWEAASGGQAVKATAERLQAVAACRGCEGSELLIETWRTAGHAVRILPVPRVMGLTQLASRVPTWLVAVAYAETDTGLALAVMGRVQRRRRNLVAERVSHVALPGRARALAEGFVAGRRMWQVSGPVCSQAKACVPATVLLAETDGGKASGPRHMVPRPLDPAAPRVAPQALQMPHVLREAFALDALHSVEITKVVTLESASLVQSETINIRRQSTAEEAPELVYHASQRQGLVFVAGSFRGPKRPLKERALRRFYLGKER